MKTSENQAAALLRGLFNARALRAAALLPAFTVGAVCASENPAPIADATVTAKRPEAVPAPDTASTTGNSGAAPSAAVAPVGVAQAAKPVPAPAKAPAAFRDTQKIPDTVVVASRREEKLAEVSPSISLVTKDEIETRQFHSVAEVIQSQPGVFVSGSTQQQGSQVSIFSRGTNSNQTAVLLDGRRLNPGLNGSSEIQRYSTSGLDSVQFARGATSTLYGANALGGVVDMRTIDPLKLAAPEGFAEVEGGSFHSVRTAAGVSGATSVLDSDGGRNDLGASVSGNLGYSDGTRDNEDFRGNNAVTHVAFSPVKAVTFETVAQVHDLNYGVPTSFGAPSPIQRQSSTGWLVSPGVILDNGDDLSAHVFYSRSESTLANSDPLDPFTFSSATTPVGALVNDAHLRTTLDEVSVQVDYKPASWALLTTGYSYNRTEFDRFSDSPFNFPNPTENRLNWESHSVWGRATATTSDKTTRVGVGGRYQAFDDFADKGTGEVFGSQKFAETGTTLHAKAATSYSTPNGQDYFFSPPSTVLKPESDKSWEIGLKQELFQKTSPLELGVVYFENYMTDLLAGESTATPPFFSRTININKARSRGVELIADWKPVKQVKFYANGTIQDARATADSPPGLFATNTYKAGDKLARRPDYMTTFGLELYPVESVTFGISGTGVMGREDTGHRDMGDYFVARAYASWRFTKYTEVFGRVENIFDENYDGSSIGFQGLPLGAYAGIRARF